MKRGQTTLAPEIKVTSETPPTFLAHAGDDPVSAENSIYMFLELRKVKVPAELHIYNSGGHGFGMRKNEKPTASWPDRFAEWMKDRGLLKAGPKA